MAEKIKDEEDRFLESMFDSAPIADDGFSDRVLRRVRRKLWARRLTLPVAAAIGGLFAFKPTVGLVVMAYKILLGTPNDVVASVINYFPSLQLVITGGLILFAAILTLNMLEE